MLSISKIGKTYPNGTVALRDITLEIGGGEIVAVVGGSGCGKSTLLRLLSGLDHPTEGTIDVDGTRIVAPHPAVGIVFQEPRLLPWLTVEQNVGFGLDHLSRVERRDRVYATLKRVGLSEYGPRWPRELSGGQRQRVAIARALAQDPELLLIDEPTASLDPKTSRQIMRLILEMCRERGLPAIINIHDVELARLFVDRIVGLRAGEIVFDATPAALDDVALTRIYGEEDWKAGRQETTEEDEPAAPLHAWPREARMMGPV